MYLFYGKTASAEKASFLQTMHGADLNAKAAGGTFFVINRGKIILHGDSAGGAVLFALHTADTAALADLSYVRAFIFVGTLYDNARRVLDKVDNAVGAGLGAKAATDAL